MVGKMPPAIIGQPHLFTANFNEKKLVTRFWQLTANCFVTFALIASMFCLGLCNDCLVS
jgi:hypothetical protein